jgi:hypothetical protein
MATVPADETTCQTVVGIAIGVAGPLIARRFELTR